MRARPGNSLRSHCRPQTGAGFLILWLLLVQFAPRVEAHIPDLSSPPPPGQPQTVRKLQAITTLELGQRIDRETSFGDTQSFRIILSQDQFAAVTVQQRGVDVVEQLFAPDGRLIAEFDDELRPQEEEQADFVSDVAGAYRLVVKPKFKNSAGRYEVRIPEIRTATENDRLRFETRKLATQVSRLHEAAKFDEALAIAAHALDIAEKQFGSEHRFVGYLLNEQASLYFRKGDFAQARELYQRAMMINQKVLGPEHYLGQLHSDWRVGQP